MVIRWIKFFSLLGIFFQATWAQFDFIDAPTRRGNSKRDVGYLEGIFVEKKGLQTPDAKNINITFILSETPSAFFDFYDEQKKAIVLDLYDTKIGESPIDSVKEHPISGSKVENIQIDLNKDVSGLKPDLRDVVRVTFNSPYNIQYEMSEEFGVISLTFDWSKKIEKRHRRSQTSIYWKAPLAALILGGAGFGVWWYWFKPIKTEVPCPVCVVDDPPGLPDQ